MMSPRLPISLPRFDHQHLLLWRRHLIFEALESSEYHDIIRSNKTKNEQLKGSASTNIRKHHYFGDILALLSCNFPYPHEGTSMADSLVKYMPL